MKIKFVKIILSVFILSIFVLNFVEAQSEGDKFKPYLHKASVGDVPQLRTFGQQSTELFSGAGTYSYDIEVPQGTNGLQPSISLNYNSQSALQRPGLLGSGWTLSQNYIVRDVNHTVDNSTDDYFVLTLGNTNFKIIYNGTNYKTETDPNKFRIQNLTNAGKIYWIVTSMDGTQYRFGFNNDSLLESNTGKSYDLK